MNYQVQYQSKHQKQKDFKKISPELDKFAQRFWYYSEKSSEEQWDNGIKNLKN